MARGSARASMGHLRNSGRLCKDADCNFIGRTSSLNDGSSQANESLTPVSSAENSSVQSLTATRHSAKLSQKYTPHRILIPSAKLAFCFAPKVASTQFSAMFNAANSKSARAFTTEMFQFSLPQKLGFKWSDVSKDNGWKFAIFVRDPLERYLSAFLSKCVANETGQVEGGGQQCEGPVLWNPLDHEQVVQAFELRALSDRARGKTADNPHWWTQTQNLELCGKSKFNVSVADYVGKLSRNVDPHDQVLSMLRMAGVSSAEWLVHKFFPHGKIAGHKTTPGTSEDYYRNPDIVQAVKELYAVDYTTFRLSSSSPRTTAPIILWIGFTLLFRCTSDEMKH